LKLEENSSGLGAMNKLFMAAELLHLETDPTNSLRLCLIEELEAHLHPQAQLRVIKALQNIENTQFILTTHSTTIGSSIPLDSLILCKNNSEGLPDVFPMWKGKTKLHEGDYRFLQRFLDSTKANLFFAKGVILVEGDAENILIPTIAEIIGKPLHRHGVSIVNVGSTAFLRYAKIFFRQDEKKLNLPVAVITDLDVRDVEYYNKYRVLENSDDLPGDYDYTKILNKKYLTKSMLIDGLLNEDQTMRMDQKKQIWDHSKECDITSDVKDELRAPLDNLRLMRKSRLEEKFSQDSVKAFVSKKWTLEYDLALSENLRDYLHQAICLAGKIKSKDEFFENLYVDGHFDISEQAKEITLPEGTDNEIAYKIFEPLLKGNASKAVTAQIFAEILQSKKHQVIDILPEDEYLKYIIDAINYVCTEEENES
jgi:putative ATP-dependent endonuclease of OLD family